MASQEPATRMWKTKMPNARSNPSSGIISTRRLRHQRQQEIAAAHGRGHVALEQLALAIVDESESHAPHAGVHQVHAEQARNQKVDVARAGLAGSLRGGGQRIRAAGGGLQGVVGLRAGQDALGACGIVAVFDLGEIAIGGSAAVGWRILGNDDEIVAAEAETVEGFGFGNDAGVQGLRGALGKLQHGVRAGSGGDGHIGNARGPRAEGDAQSECQQEREEKDPEDDFGLALHFAEARAEKMGVTRPAAIAPRSAAQPGDLPARAGVRAPRAGDFFLTWRFAPGLFLAGRSCFFS